MTKPRRKKKSIKLKVKRAVKFIQKNDTADIDTVGMKKAPFIMNDNGPNMRIKIKRKSR